MSDGAGFLRFLYITIFFFLFTFILFATLAYVSEKDYEALRYSYNPKNLWGPEDMYCGSHGSTNSSGNAVMTIVDFNNKLQNQQLKFPYILNNNKTESIFEIYFADTLPTNLDYTVSGISAGYKNYSANGTSIYLQGYNSAVSWNNSNVANLFSQAFKGTSFYSEKYATLTQSGDKLIYDINNVATYEGLSIIDNVSGASSIIGAVNIPLTNPTLVNTTSKNLLNVMDHLEATNKIIEAGKTDDAKKLCIDPSYTSKNLCSDLIFNGTSNIYCGKHNPGCSNICTPDQDPMNDDCGVLFCYGGNTHNGTYQTNYIDLQGFAKTTTPITDQDYNVGNNNLGDIYGSQNAQQSPQYQKLLFCGGTQLNSGAGGVSTASTNYNDSTDLTPSGDTSALTTPLEAKYPNVTIAPNKPVVLGFK